MGKGETFSEERRSISLIRNYDRDESND